MSSPKMMRSGGGLQKGHGEESGSEMASRSLECGGPYYLRVGGAIPEWTRGRMMLGHNVLISSVESGLAESSQPR
jgi:hypothetical protein